MNRKFNKNIFSLSGVIISVLSGFFVCTTLVSAEIPGEALSANVGAAGLLEIASNWPYLLLIGLVIVILLVVANLFYRPKPKNDK